MIRSLILAVATAAVLASPAAAQRRDQDAAYEAARSGAILSLGEIKRRVDPMVGGRYIDHDFDSGTRRYSLKYMREGEKVIVEVDARNGNVLRRSDR
jgi:uncharacterized membrane protein YkoI